MGYSLGSVGQGGCQAEPWGAPKGPGEPGRPPVFSCSSSPTPTSADILGMSVLGALWALCVPVIAGRGFGVDTGVGLGDEDTSGTVSQ